MSIIRTGLFSDLTDSGSGFATGAMGATVQAGDGSGLTLWVVVQGTGGPVSGNNTVVDAVNFPGSGGTAMTLVDQADPGNPVRDCYIYRLDDPGTDASPQQIHITFGDSFQRPDGYTVAYVLTNDGTGLRGAVVAAGGVNTPQSMAVTDCAAGDEAVAVVSSDDDGDQADPTITNTSGQTTAHDIGASSLDDWYASRLTTRTASAGTHTETFTYSAPHSYAVGALLVFALGESGDPPETAPTPGAITPTLDGASIVAPTLSEDADGVEYELDDSGTWVDVEDDDPIVITGQDPNTQYDIRFRFYNSIGAGPESDPETYTTLNGVQSVQVIERTETSVHVRVTTNTTGWLSVGLLPENDSPSLTQLVAGFTSEGEPNYQYGWIGGGGGQVEITEAGTFDVEVGDWTNPDNGGPVPNPLDENTAYRIAAALFTTVAAPASNIGDIVFADIPAFGEGGPVISRPSVFGITSSGARVRVQLGDYHSSATASLGVLSTEVSPATVSGTMYLSIVPDPTGDPEDWPDGDEIIAETGAVYADSQAVATSYIPLFFGLGVGGPQEYGGLLIDFTGITGLTPGTDYVASLVQRDAGVNSTPVYFPFSTEPRFSAHIKEGFANGSPTANSGPFKLTGDDLAFAALVQFEHPEMGYDEPGGGSTPTSTIPDGEGDGFYLGVHDPGTDISETAEFYPPTWYYGGEGQGLIEDGEVAFTLRTGVTGGDNIEVFVGSSGGGSTDYDGIQSDSNVVLALAMRGVKGTYHQQVSDDALWNTIQESPFTISRTVLARPGDSVLAIVLVNVGPGAGEGNGLDTGLTLTPISGVDEVLPQWSNIAVSGSSYLNTANSIHVAVCSREATGEPNENGFVSVDVGWDLAESADDYPDNGPGYRLITFVVSEESSDPPTISDILTYPNAVFPIHDGGSTTEARIDEGEPVTIGETGGIGGLTANTTYDAPGLQLREFGGEWSEPVPFSTREAVGPIIIRVTPPPPEIDLQAPTITEGTVTHSSVQIDISGGNDIETLTPQHKLAAAEEWTSGEPISPSASSYTFTDLDDETSYNFRMMATHGEESDTSNTLTVETDEVPVEDDLEHGEEFTILGAGFGNRPDLSSVLFDDASTGSITDNWSGRWPSGSGAEYNMAYRTPIRDVELPHEHGSRYICGAAYPGTDANSGWNVSFWRNIQRPEYIYASWYERTDPDWVFNLGDPNDNNFKNLDYTQGGPYGNGFYISWNGTSSASAASSRSWGMNNQGDGTPLQGSAFPDWQLGSVVSTFNDWVKIEVEIKVSDSSDGYIHLTQNGQRSHATRYTGRTDNMSGTSRTLNIGGYSRGRDADNWRYFSDVYVDTSRARVVLTNNADIDESTVIELQPPVIWADDEIICVCNMGRLSGTVHVHVRNESGTWQYLGTREEGE